MKKHLTRGINLAFLSALLLFFFMFSSCDKDNDNNTGSGITPKGPKPAWGPDITPPMQTVIEKLEQLTDTTPIYVLTPQQARLAPSAADAVKGVMQDYNITAPIPNVDTMGMEIPVAGGSIHARIYTPRTGRSSYPVIVYYHGGGFVIATVDTYNSSAQALAEQTDAIVVSVEYRKAPEYKFPAAHDDANTAYVWALNNAQGFKGDTTKLAVAGESAGGNLAANVSRFALLSGIRKPLAQVLIYPVANNDTTTASMNMYAMAMPLSRPALNWFYGYYLNSPADGDDPRLSLSDVADLTGSPATTIIAAEIDPLQTEGKQLADKLQSQGADVVYKLYPGVTHEFFGMNTVLPEAVDAEALAASRLKAAFQ